LSIANLAAVF